MDQIVDFINYVALISVGAERFTEMAKRMYLEKVIVNKNIYPIITFAIGVVMAAMQPFQHQLFNFNEYVICIITGLLVSGGSSVVNEILTAMNQFNKQNKPVVK